MTYKPNALAEASTPPPGVGPWREMSDEEFAAVEATYDAQFAAAGTLRRFFDHDGEQVAATRRARTPREGG